MFDPGVILVALLLLGVANGTPVFANKLLKDRFAAPLDGGFELPDRQPFFGGSKTVRGLALSIAATALTGRLLGFGWGTGALFAAASLSGDLLSSFIKRRLKLTLHARASGLDQIPEALLPLLLLHSSLQLSAVDMVATVAAFVIVQVVVSPILFSLRIRDRPY
jgi:CDP-2,3-bis-(O-geranylgeranyl)-sn-glycerol synthase